MALSRAGGGRAALLPRGARAAGARGAGAQEPHQSPISLDATSSEVDYKTNTVVFKDVVIAQGNVRVQAEHAHATGLNFDNRDRKSTRLNSSHSQISYAVFCL